MIVYPPARFGKRRRRFLPEPENRDCVKNLALGCARFSACHMGGRAACLAASCLQLGGAATPHGTDECERPTNRNSPPTGLDHEGIDTMINPKSLAGRLCGLNLRLGSWDRARLGRRRADRRFQVAAEVLRLEERTMLSRGVLPPAQLQVPIPAGQLKNDQVALSTIIWNGGPPLNTSSNFANVPSPSQAGAMKTVALTNNGPNTIYPFLRGENGGKDPNATSANVLYDPQDLMNKEFREYIGYQTRAGKFLGLPSGASITFQVPLVLWDGDNLEIVTDPAHFTSNTALYNYLYFPRICSLTS